MDHLRDRRSVVGSFTKEIRALEWLTTGRRPPYGSMDTILSESASVKLFD